MSADWNKSKTCECLASKSYYSCVRCRDAFCMMCDGAAVFLDTVMYEPVIKSTARWCSNWRCQREKQLEEGTIVAVPRPRDDTESRFFGGPLEVGSWSMYETNSIKLEAMRVDLADVISEIRDLEAPAVSTEYWALADAACRKVIK